MIKNGFVTPILELPDNAERHSVAQRDVGRRRIHPQLDAKRLGGFGAALQLFPQVLLGEHALTPAAQ